MPAYPSRARRPADPRPLVLTERDDAILASVFEHRFIASRHAHWLHFRGASLRAAQRRLRRLWAHGHLDRAFVPTIVLGEGSDVPHTGGPLYCLAERGARRVAETTGRPYRDIPSTPAQNRVGFETLCHHLVATDWLTSLVAAAEPNAAVERLVRERWLRRSPSKTRQLLVPDAAVALRTPNGIAWCYLEVVRADPRGGRKTIRAKLQRYARLHHVRAFRAGYGHHPVRRVLFVTTSEARRDNLLELARALEHGRELFAFASYTPGQTMTGATRFTPDAVHAPMWCTADRTGERSLVALLTPTQDATE